MKEVTKDKCISLILLAVAMSAISGLALITIFIFKEGLPIMMKVGVGKFSPLKRLVPAGRAPSASSR